MVFYLQLKLHGSLGISRLEEFNLPFIQKLAWNALNHQEAIWAQVLKAKYFPHSSLLAVDPKQRASLIWQGLSRVLNMLKENICFLPCNGATIGILTDPWISTKDGHRPDFLPSVSISNSPCWVTDLVDVSTGMCNMALLTSFFTPNTVAHIVTMAPSTPDHHNSILWTLNPCGVFSVKEAVLQA